MNNNIAVELKNLSKIYGSHAAVDSMNLTLEANKIYGLLGRNGAGKTMLNILTGRIFASGGRRLCSAIGRMSIETLKKSCFIEKRACKRNQDKSGVATCRRYIGWDAVRLNLSSV